MAVRLILEATKSASAPPVSVILREELTQDEPVALPSIVITHLFYEDIRIPGL